MCPHNAQSHELLQRWADSITLEEVNALAASYLAYISHYRAEAELLEAAARGERRFAGPGPVRATSIVACLPAFTDPSGHSSGAPRSTPPGLLRCTPALLLHTLPSLCVVIITVASQWAVL